MFSCVKIVVLVVLLLLISAISLIIYTLSKIRPCDLESTIEIQDGVFENDSLIVHDLIFEKGEYYTDKRGITRICPIGYCKKHDDKPCVRKCCPPDQIIRNESCKVENEDRFGYDKIPLPYLKDKSKRSINVFHGYPCEFVYNTASFSLTKEGYLKEVVAGSLDDHHFRYDIQEYCIDHEEVNGTIIINAWVCFPPLSEQKSRAFEYYKYFVIASVVFFVLTILTYAIIPDLRRVKRSLHGWCLMTHVACFVFTYASLALVQLGINYSPLPCKLLGYTFYYSFLAGFLWMNVMCFDMWWTFRSSNPVSQFNHNKFSYTQKYVFYSIYAFGTPFLFLIVVYLLDTFLAPDNRFKPEIGNVDKTCFMNKRDALWVTFYTPLAAVLIINTVLFADTVNKMMASFRVIEDNLDTKAIQNKRRQYKKVILYLKLFMVMGVSWLMELMSFIFATDVSDYWWYLSDVINSSRGLLIFAIYVLKREVIGKLNNKLCPSIQIIRYSPSFMSSSSSRSRRKSAFSRQTSKIDQVVETNFNDTSLKKTNSPKKRFANDSVVFPSKRFQENEEEPIEELFSRATSGSCDELRSIEEVEEYEDRIEDPVRKETERERQTDQRNESTDTLTEENEMKSKENPSQDMRKRDSFRD